MTVRATPQSVQTAGTPVRRESPGGDVGATELFVQKAINTGGKYYMRAHYLHFLSIRTVFLGKAWGVIYPLSQVTPTSSAEAPG